MFNKKIKLSEGSVIAIFIGSIIISVLYIRMKNAEKMLEEYSIARMCILPTNCREIVKVRVTDYGLSKFSFTNYGSKGIPLERGSFQNYVFVISTNGSEDRSVKVLPNSVSSLDDFDLENIYIPTKSDAKLQDENLFKDKSVYVEIWQGKITFILVNSNGNNSVLPEGSRTDVGVSIGPSNSIVYELALPTENHPAILSEFARNDFFGWSTIGAFLGLMVFSSILWQVMESKRKVKKDE